MDTAKKVINKIRHKFKREQKPEDPIIKLVAEVKAEAYQQSLWERDKKIVRDDNFKKARLAMEEHRKEVQTERERQRTIAEQRLKNLKKARRRLAKIRSEQ